MSDWSQKNRCKGVETTPKIGIILIFLRFGRMNGQTDIAIVTDLYIYIIFYLFRINVVYGVVDAFLGAWQT